MGTTPGKSGTDTLDRLYVVVGRKPFPREVILRPANVLTDEPIIDP